MLSKPEYEKMKNVNGQYIVPTNLRAGYLKLTLTGHWDNGPKYVLFKKKVREVLVGHPVRPKFFSLYIMY